MTSSPEPERLREVEIPKSAYVHVPFCRHRCGYCNFTVIAGRDDLVPTYLRGVRRELQHQLETPHPVETLFCGGGTPTHLRADELGEFLELISTYFPLLPGGEFSVEANPEDLDAMQLEQLCKSGVTRISLGVQSFHTEKLTLLERSHRKETIETAVRCLHTARREQGLQIAIDLIFGAPGETVPTWRADLDQALALQPDHLSTYGLTYERGTRFHTRRERHELEPVNEEVDRQLYETAIETLTSAGYEHYEVSNFARPGKRCRHNENYWLGGSFFGIGPGAASYLKGCRATNHRSTTTYLKRVFANGSAIAESETLSPECRARERLVFGLRRLEGVETNSFTRATGYSIERLGSTHLPWLVQSGWLEWVGSTLRLTRSGLLISDSLWPYLLVD